MNQHAIPACLAALLLILSVAPALALQAGVVNRVQGPAEAARNGQRVALNPGSEVHVGDVLVTGPEARLAVRFTDGTLLTLGADTTITVDEYVYCADGSLALDLAGGVFRIISGELARLNPDKFVIQTPLAVIGIRGTDFWGGFLETGKLDVLLITGTAVTVRNPGGTVTLTEPGVGVTVGAQDRMPMLPKEWTQDKKTRALSSVAFD